MKELFQYSNVLKEYIVYLKSISIDPQRMLQLDIKSNLGYILEYLDSKGIYCLVDNYHLIVYFNGKSEETLNYIKVTNRICLIKEIETSHKDVIDNYCMGINEAFKYLNNPF